MSKISQNFQKSLIFHIIFLQNFLNVFSHYTHTKHTHTHTYTQNTISTKEENNENEHMGMMGYMITRIACQKACQKVPFHHVLRFFEICYVSKIGMGEEIRGGGIPPAHSGYGPEYVFRPPMRTPLGATVPATRLPMARRRRVQWKSVTSCSFDPLQSRALLIFRIAFTFPLS